VAEDEGSDTPASESSLEAVWVSESDVEEEEETSSSVA
jgi:hypothetical protein